MKAFWILLIVLLMPTVAIAQTLYIVGSVSYVLGDGGCQLPVRTTVETNDRDWLFFAYWRNGVVYNILSEPIAQDDSVKVKTVISNVTVGPNPTTVFVTVTTENNLVYISRSISVYCENGTVKQSKAVFLPVVLK